MSPVLPREERDAIEVRNDRVGHLDGRHDRLWIEAAGASLDDVPALWEDTYFPTLVPHRPPVICGQEVAGA